jgi:hypothetical protein
MNLHVLLAALVLLGCTCTHAEPLLSAETVVFQTNFGDVEFKFMPEVGRCRTQANSAARQLPATEHRDR